MTITAPEADIDTSTGDQESCQGIFRTGESDALRCDRPAEYEHIWDKKCCGKTTRTVHCRECSADEVARHALWGAVCATCLGPAVLVMVVPL